MSPLVRTRLTHAQVLGRSLLGGHLALPMSQLVAVLDGVNVEFRHA